MQRKLTINPLFINTDVSFEKMKPYESPYIRGLDFDINKNPISDIGTNNPTGIGQNQLVKSQVSSNAILPTALAPDGFNLNIGSFESTTTQELYYFNYNSNLKHGIYVLNGNTGIWNKVIEDSQLLFTDDAEAFIAGHRCTLRFVKDKDGNIIEKYLLLTNGNSWHKYINVIAAIKTNGFDSSLYPYWGLRQPHFDRRELLEWAVRPPMIKPIVTALANTDADKGKINKFVDKGIQVAYAFQNTDGRTTTLSPYSLPVLIKTEDYLTNPDSIPKNVSVKLYAGSAMTEKILLYVRTAKKNSNTLQSIQEWADWYLYDTIKRFPNSNTGEIVGSEYWTRTNQWAAYNYDTVFNAIDYSFDLSKITQIVSQEDANQLFTEMPQLSVGMTDLGDAALLGDNRYGYPNFDDSIINSFTTSVKEKTGTSCITPLRKIRLYAYVGMCGDDFSYTSQVGYYVGDDKQVRFGGLREGSTYNNNTQADVNVDESKSFGLDFGDKNAFRCYLKGTPYYADGEWYKVNSDNSLVKLGHNFDFNDSTNKTEAQKILIAQGYFICVFDIVAPAGRYIATLGRHNVDSDGDYRNTSTYIYGIANSRMKTLTNIFHYKDSNIPGAPSLLESVTPLTSIKPNAINNGNGILYSKEMELDCTQNDIDVWGNGSDLFYVYCPYITKRGNLEYRFIEGYEQEAAENPVPVEMFPYQLTRTTDDSGKFTDKNGFYWAYTKSARSNTADMQFVCKLNCTYPFTFSIPTSQVGSGWKQNAVNYIADQNGGVFGVQNRILYFGKITSLDGLTTYSNIAISIKDGATVYSKSDGTFILIVHNGMNVLRNSNVYVNAGGNFLITIANCGAVPLSNFSESFAPCIYPLPANAVRSYPYNLNLAVMISSDRDTSLKETGKYFIGGNGADLAGREMFVNVLSENTVSSFLERNDIKPTYFNVAVNTSLNLSAYPDMKWFIFSVSKNVNVKRYIQWVGDEISYIDNNGNTVTDPANAVFCSIKINSLYNSNVAKNFSLLSSYQFAQNDRLRILDDGNGQLLDIADYGEPIDLQILGTNYQQAAIDAGLLAPETNTVLTTQTVSPDVTLIVKYDSRLDNLIDKKGFWIEIYTPTEQSDSVPFYEDKTYPVINGKIAIFTGFSNGKPVYSYPASIDLDFWDTYFFDRNITIPDVGNKFFSHPFESQNVTDNWGADLISGGRNNTKNDAAKQYWLGGETIKSDDFLKQGLINGLATFRYGNKKDFGTYPFGAITAMYSARNILILVCENDWYTTDYNRRYAYTNEQGMLVASLNEGLNPPREKQGDIYGLSKEDTRTFIVNDKFVYWYDRKNTAFLRCNFYQAIDVTVKSESEQGGMQSYFNSKSDFITDWNNNHTKQNSFNVVAGVDVELNKIYLTFRCRRNNTKELSSFINDRRDWQLNFQETIVYDANNHGWLRAEGFTPEGYGSLRGNATGTQLITFASGKPYLHKTEENGFNQFYGVQTQAVLHGVLNADESLPVTIAKEFDGLYYSGNPSGWYCDLLYTDFRNSFSYLSSNQFSKFLNNYYAGIMKNMNSYPSNNTDDLFRSMLFDGYFMRSKYLVFRLICDYASRNEYKEVGEITALVSVDDSNVK